MMRPIFLFLRLFLQRGGKLRPIGGKKNTMCVAGGAAKTKKSWVERKKKKRAASPKGTQFSVVYRGPDERFIVAVPPTEWWNLVEGRVCAVNEYGSGKYLRGKFFFVLGCSWGPGVPALNAIKKNKLPSRRFPVTPPGRPRPPWEKPQRGGGLFNNNIC